MSTTAPAPPTTSRHPLDRISHGKIVQIREQLLAAQAQGAKVYRFESGDPSFGPPAYVLEAVTRAGQQGKTHYVPNNGVPELRTALARKVTAINGIAQVRDRDIFVTNGAMHALFVTFGALLAAGDEVIIPDPMWTEVAENIRMAGGVPVGVTLRYEDDFSYRPEAIERAVTPRTVAIFLNTPHNPTGAVLTKERLGAILELARARNLWVVADEAYEDVVFAPAEHHSIGALAGEDWERVISIYSFSKSHAMAGLRTGYIVTRSAQLQDRIPKLLRCTINGVNSLAQAAALAAVTGDRGHIAAMRAEYLVRRDLMLETLGHIPGLRPFTPRGTFFIWV